MTTEPPAILRQRVVVPFEYAVAFTTDAFATGNDLLVSLLTQREPGRRHRVLAVLDAGLEAAWPELRGELAAYFARHADKLELVAPPLTMPGGEAAKNDPALVGVLHDAIAKHGLDRHSYVLIMGGGGVLDAAGYAAATAHRGVRTVRMPTTVLAQDDSGVGVKNGINGFGAKNFVGTFSPPFAVINDLRFLRRLPVRDRVAGLAEGVKVALIRDGGFFTWIESCAAALAAGDEPVLAPFVRRCAELHMRHIADGGDPFELGSARPLDYGHWSAHKLETLTDHALRHGEAVAIGMLLDARYATRVGMLSDAEFARLRRLLVGLGLPVWHEALAANGPDGAPVVLRGLDEFREHLGGELTITLLRGIGAAVEVNEVDRAAMAAAIHDLRALASP